MATIRKRKGKWQVQIRHKGRPSFTRSFLLKSDAVVWSHQKELDAERRGLVTANKALARITVADVLVRYRDEVVPRKRGADRETLMINVFLRHPLARTAISELTTGMVSSYCDFRRASVTASSVNRELDIFRHAFVVAKRNWDVPIADNPFAMITREKPNAPRTRRLMDGEAERLAEACAECRNPYVGHLVQFALATAMRRGELLSVSWRNLSLATRTLHIEETKNGHPRTIPLSGAAIGIVRLLEANRRPNDDLLIPISVDAAKLAWRRLIKRAGLSDFRFHDLRHEAISRFFELGLSVPEVALISGHLDARMLFRYTHPKADLIAKKLMQS